jgi:hypothetical protein
MSSSVDGFWTKLFTTTFIVSGLLTLAILPIVVYQPVYHRVEKVADNLWSQQHEFMYDNIVPLSSRIVTIRNPDTNELAIYNPIPDTKEDYRNFGTIKLLIVGNADHVSFLPAVAKEYGVNGPLMLVPPGQKKVLQANFAKAGVSYPNMEEFSANSLKDFPSLEWKKIEGFEFLNEVVLFHKPTGFLIVTDSAVDTTEEEYPGYPFLPIRLIAMFTDVYYKLGVKTDFRKELNDAKAVRKSINDICDTWEIKGCLMAHGKNFVDEYTELYYRSAWMQRTSSNPYAQ